MTFQIKDFPSIIASMINHARSVTDKVSDYAPGSVVRTVMEGPGVEIEELYLQMLLGLRDAIPLATYLSFDFDTLPAKVARGFVSVSISPAPDQPITIPSCTAFITDDNRTYTSTAAVTWQVGANVVHIPVQASSAGLSGNISAGVIVQSDFFNNAYTVSNGAITNGANAETETERKARFAEFISSLSRGTVVACTFAAKQARVLDVDGNISEYVTRIGMAEGYGTATIYVYSSAGLPSAELLADAQRRIDGSRDPNTGVVTPGYRAAGIEMPVLSMVERAVGLAVRVSMFPGYALDSSVEQALQDIFGSAILGIQPETTMYLGDLVKLLLAAPGVRAIVPTTGENIICNVNETLLPGAFTVTAL